MRNKNVPPVATFHWSFLVPALVVLSGCYTVTLDPISPQSKIPPDLLTASLDVPPDTAMFRHTVRSVMAGSGNTWTIEVGAALAHYADAYLAAAFPEDSDHVLRVELENFDVNDFEAHCDVRFTVTRAGDVVFQKSYHGQGTGYAAPVIWGGAFAMKSAMRRTTDEALRSVLDQFLRDLQSSATCRMDDQITMRDFSTAPRLLEAARVLPSE